MKKILLLGSVFLASVLVGCTKYPSEEQAGTACWTWAKKGEKVSYIRLDFVEGSPLSNETQTSKTNRYCTQELTTRQFLGRQGIFSAKEKAKEGKKLFYDFPEVSNEEIVKHFRY